MPNSHGEQHLSEIETVKGILSSAFFMPVGSIRSDDRLENIKGMDSLSFEALILEIERVTGQEPDPLRLLEIKTISDLAAMIAEMKSAAVTGSK